MRKNDYRAALRYFNDGNINDGVPKEIRGAAFQALQNVLTDYSCNKCKYSNRDAWEMPCVQCVRVAKDYYKQGE